MSGVCLFVFSPLGQLHLHLRGLQDLGMGRVGAVWHQFQGRLHSGRLVLAPESGRGPALPAMHGHM